MKFLILLVLLSSCYTSKKATEQVNKADAKYPGVVAKLARDKYPCQELFKTDTTIVYSDSLIFIDCPELMPNDYANGKTDTITINNIVYRTVKVPVKMPVKIIYIGRWYEDSAKLKVVTIVANKLQGENEILKSKLATRSKFMWIFLAIALLSTGWTARKLFT